MSKIKITKKIVDKTPQLAEVLAEKGFKIGDEVEDSQLEEFVNIANTTELKELTEADFESEPALAEEGFKVGDKVRILKDVEDTEGSEDLEGSEGENSEKGDEEQNSQLSVKEPKQPKAPKAEKQPSKPKEKPRYEVISDFLDKNDNSVIYKIGDEVSEDFEAERIADLIDRGLIEQI